MLRQSRLISRPGCTDQRLQALGHPGLILWRIEFYGGCLKTHHLLALHLSFVKGLVMTGLFSLLPHFLSELLVPVVFFKLNSSHLVQLFEPLEMVACDGLSCRIVHKWRVVAIVIRDGLGFLASELFCELLGRRLVLG